MKKVGCPVPYGLNFSCQLKYFVDCIFFFSLFPFGKCVRLLFFFSSCFWFSSFSFFCDIVRCTFRCLRASLHSSCLFWIYSSSFHFTRRWNIVYFLLVCSFDQLIFCLWPGEFTQFFIVIINMETFRATCGAHSDTKKKQQKKQYYHEFEC